MKRLLSCGLAALALALALGPAAARAAPQAQLCTLPGVVQFGFQVCPQPFFLNGQGQLVTPQGVVVGGPGFFLNPQGQLVTPQGVVIDPSGFVLTPQGLVFNPQQLDDDAHGRLVSCVARHAPHDDHGHIVSEVAREGIEAADDSVLLGSLVAQCLAEIGTVTTGTTTFVPVPLVNAGRDDDDHDRRPGRDRDHGDDDHGSSRGDRGRGH
ncbi:MAG TPA: hypothetical protein VFE37_25240 [Chloroflexota bacterium]|nr:hypothetical protein [Chloroflexota bacterium]